VIINSLCNSFLQPYQILVETRDIGLLRQIASDDGGMAPCPRLCGGAINLVGDPTITAMTSDPRLKQPMKITGTELYRAVNGAGLPDELPQSRETVEAILKANKVVEVKVEELNGKLYLHEMSLENGLTIHLASGIRGAQVLKVTREGP